MVSMSWKIVSVTQYQFYKIITCTKLYSDVLLRILTSTSFSLSPYIYIYIYIKKQIYNLYWQLLSSILAQMKTEKDHKGLITQGSIMVAPQEVYDNTNWTLVESKQTRNLKEKERLQHMAKCPPLPTVNKGSPLPSKKAK